MTSSQTFVICLDGLCYYGEHITHTGKNPTLWF